MNDNMDLTQGSIAGRLFTFFLPIAAGTIFQQLYNAVDGIVVGRFVGTQALAAVGGSPAVIVNLIVGFFTALSAGFAVIVSQLFGAKEEKDMSKAVGTAISFSLIIGLIVSVICIAFAPEFLKWMGTPEETIADATLYLRIYFIGTIFITVLNMESSILRAVGDSKHPFIYMIISCAMNIILDVTFVVYCGWGVAGVAIATVIAQVLNMLLLSYQMTVKNSPCKFEFGDLKIDRGFLGKMLRIGVPSGLQSSMYGISNLLLQVGVNSLGTVVVASWALSGKTDGLFWAITSAAGAAITTFTGQNYGAGRIDRIKQSVKVSMILFSIITVLTSVALLALGIPMLHILTPDQAVVETTYQIMCYLVPMYFLWTGIEVFSGILKGIGDSVYPVIITGIGICLFRIVWLVTVFRLFPTLPSLCICYPASWLVTDIALVWYYYKKSMISKEYR